jgi:FKBP-type peptidyl-prolyl cis-trans isomerase
MERKKMLQVLIPAAAVAGVVLLIGVLVSLGNGTADGKDKDKAKGSHRSAAFDDAGMANVIPPLDAPDWKPGPGQMRVWEVAEGEGEPCPPGANVTIHYAGWLKDGKLFDSSRKALADKLPPGRMVTGEPATFGLGGLIRGWQEGIPGMKPGGIRRLDIPYDWAYGPEGGRGIPPKADLVFEVKLLEWRK